MKQNLHPDYQETTVTCACGNTFTVGGTAKSLHVDVCNKCHPFFTGQHKFVDIKGRIDKFKEKQAQGVAYKAKKEASTAQKKAKDKKSK